ncbi:MAG TPA: hypothetical protein VEZ90_18735, partial [Blastocatellia bacterium]|nr:hypothetical protein [Blastocatellia bacterium]
METAFTVPVTIPREAIINSSSDGTLATVVENATLANAIVKPRPSNGLTSPTAYRRTSVRV